MTQKETEAYAKKIRKSLTIGQKVLVTPIWGNKYKPAGKPTTMYVRELHNPLTAGLSSKKTSKTGIYRILYELITPYPEMKVVTKNKSQTMQDQFEQHIYLTLQLSREVRKLSEKIRSLEQTMIDLVNAPQ